MAGSPARGALDQARGAKKRFGQNFLHDAGVLTAIADAPGLRPDDAVVEIGPGRGALTEQLLQRVERITAIELDRDLHPVLEKRFGDRLTLVAADVLSVDFAQLAEAAGRPLRIVGNLPYNISSPILFHLFPLADRFQDQLFMLQREVVERMVAVQGEAAYGRLSVMLQARYAMELRLEVPPEAFVPAPKVWSAVVQMWPLPASALQVQCWTTFQEVVAQAFSMRRKMIRNTLAPFAAHMDLEALGLLPTLRPEDVPVQAYIDLSNQIRARRMTSLASR